MEVWASLCQGRTAAAQCGLFTHKSVPVIFELPCITPYRVLQNGRYSHDNRSQTYRVGTNSAECAAVAGPSWLPDDALDILYHDAAAFRHTVVFCTIVTRMVISPSVQICLSVTYDGIPNTVMKICTNCARAFVSL